MALRLRSCPGEVPSFAAWSCLMSRIRVRAIPAAIGLAIALSAVPAGAAPDGDRARDDANATARKRNLEALEKRVSRDDAAARRAIGSLCSGCGGAARATTPRSTPAGRTRAARPLRPEEAPNYEWVPPVEDPD
jgi:hypothetical protein